MNRIIKFRGYDKEFEKMTYFDDEEYDYRPPLVFRLEQVFRKDENYDDYEDFEYNDITEKIEIMQFTGLHDKNGKEIYEGDIVKADYFSVEVIGRIKFDRGGFAITDSIIGTGAMFTLKDIEVMGNIYENPEMLEV